MVEMTFEPEMLDTLAKMKGKTFKSYEGYFPGPWPVVPDEVRINLGSFAVDIRCWYKEVDGWRDVFVYDPPCVLSCFERRLDEPFRSDSAIAEDKVVLVGERVTGVSVIRYAVEADDELEAVIDMAVAIRTKQRTYTFSRGIWFASEFFIAAEDDVFVDYTEGKFATDWAGDPNDGTAPRVMVTRTDINL